jgi:hypothetical protein
MNVVATITKTLSLQTIIGLLLGELELSLGFAKFVTIDLGSSIWSLPLNC